MDLSYLGEGVDTGLDGSDFACEGKVGIGRTGGAVESRDEDGFGGRGGVGEDAVGALDEPGPEATGEQGALHILGRESRDALGAEVCILLVWIGLDQYSEKFSLLAPDYLFHGAAHGGSDEDVRVFLV